MVTTEPLAALKVGSDPLPGSRRRAWLPPRMQSLFRKRREKPGRRLSRFAGDRSGVAAIEFAFLAVPFFALLFALIEISLTYFSNQVLETAVTDASRLIMTGQAQGAEMTATQFRQEICNRLPPMFDCATDLDIDVRPAASFAGGDVSSPLVNGAVSWSPQFNMGGPGEIIVVRAVYPIPVFANMFGVGLANMEDGRRLLMASSAFRNEPFGAP